MVNLSKDAILELFDFNKKKVLCYSIDLAHIIGLVNRGAEVWLKKADQEKFSQLGIDPYYKNFIYFMNDGLFSDFDYLLVNDFQYAEVNDCETFFAKEHIVIIAGAINFNKLFFRIKPSYLKKNKTMYSIVPSLNNVKLIIPEQINVSVRRFWTLRSKNPLLSIKLLIEWFFIRNNILRKMWADKLIIISC
jgi:hypothetical protein